MTETPIAGLMLAAGEGRRYGGDKLLATLSSGRRRGVPIGIAAYRRLSCAIPGSTVVLRAEDLALRALFEREGANIVIAHDAGEGLARSLAAGIERIQPERGVVVALADMPWIESATIRRIARAIALGASMAAPCWRGRRGHPVGFAPAHRAALLELRGDEGARAIIAAHRESLTLIEVDDPGVLRDVDTPGDLRDEGS